MSSPEYQQLLASVNIMTQISQFFYQLSEDNSFMKSTKEMKDFIFSLESIINIENCEFVTNLTLFYFNAVGRSGMMSDPQNLDFVKSVITKVIGF